ncbi:MAG: choice-of-anchor E domain-containing protein [Planctomycetota bacterium]
MKNRIGFAFAALALGVGAPLPVLAGSIVQTRDFSFNLAKADADANIPASILGGGWDLILNGSQNLSFDQYAAGSGSALQSVSLELETDIGGGIEIYNVGGGPIFGLGASQPYERIGFASAAEVGPLRAEAEFGDYVFQPHGGGTGNAGNVGFLLPDGPDGDALLVVDSFGEGSDTSDLPADLAAFVGDGTIEGFIAACLMLDYGKIGTDGNAGNASGDLTPNASGTVTLTYNFAPGDSNGGPQVIPTPAALPAGLLMLSALGLRRRDRVEV